MPLLRRYGLSCQTVMLQPNAFAWFRSILIPQCNYTMPQRRQAGSNRDWVSSTVSNRISGTFYFPSHLSGHQPESIPWDPKHKTSAKTKQRAVQLPVFRQRWFLELTTIAYVPSDAWLAQPSKVLAPAPRRWVSEDLMRTPLTRYHISLNSSRNNLVGCHEAKHGYSHRFEPTT